MYSTKYYALYLVFIQKSIDKYGPDQFKYDRVSYVDHKTKVTLYHSVCYYYFDISTISHLSGPTGCSYCAAIHKTYHRKKPLYFWLDLLSKQTNIDVSECKLISADIGYYGYKDSKITGIKCTVCDRSYDYWTKSIRYGNGCQTCNYAKYTHRLKMDIDEFRSRGVEVHGQRYNYTDTSLSLRKIGKQQYTVANSIKCNYCSTVFSQLTHHHLNGGYGCGACGLKTERKAIEFLIESGFILNRQASFEELRRINPLRFDASIMRYDSNKMVLLEVDGILHFKPLYYLGGQLSHDRSKESDYLKEQFCIYYKIPLIRIEVDFITKRNSTWKTDLLAAVNTAFDKGDEGGIIKIGTSYHYSTQAMKSPTDYTEPSALALYSNNTLVTVEEVLFAQFE